MKRENIDCGKEFDWGKASESYAKYRDIYPVEFYQRILDLGYCKNGQAVLDLATGTGALSDEEIERWEIEHKAMLSSYPKKFTIPHYATILDLEKGNYGIK